MLKLDLYPLLSKIGSFEPFVHTLFCVVASFYQGGRGSTLRGKWMISSQIERRRWRISLRRRLILPFRRKRGEDVGHISHGRRLILPFRRKRGEKVGRISRMQDPEGVCPSLIHGKAWDGALSLRGSLFINPC